MLGEATHVLITEAVGSTNETGEWVPGASTETTVVGSLQPMGGRELLQFEEGLRTRIRWKLYSLTELNGGKSEGDPRGPDRIVVDGDALEVRTINDWTGFGMSPEHFKYLLLGPEVGEGAS